MLKLKKKNPILEYDNARTKDNILIEQFPNNFIDQTIDHKRKRPKWWDDMPLFYWGFNSQKKLLESKYDEVLDSGQESYRTFKTCPGIGAYFNRAMNIKWPCDVLFEINEDESITYRASNPNYISIQSHEHSLTGHLADIVIVKVSIPLIIRNKDFDITFQDSTFYRNNPFRVSPGILERSNKPTLLNCFLFFPKQPRKYFFQSGDIYATIVTSKPNVILKHSDLRPSFNNYLQEIKRSFFKTKWSYRDVDNE